MNIVIVGFGIAGKHYLQLLKNKKIKNVFIIDKDKKIKSKYYKITTFEKIKKENIFFNFAIISSPSGAHYEHAKFFLNRKSNVLIEKPFVLRLDHAKVLIDISKKYKLKCWTSLQNRYNLATSKLKKEIQKKNIGKINLVDCTMLWHRDKKYYQSDWRGKYASDGGVLTNQAIHLLDTLIYNFGNISYFDVFADFDKKKLQAEDLIIINFRHENGTFSSLKATTRANENFRSAIDVVGSNGRIIVKGISLNTFNKFNGRKLILSKKNSEEFSDGSGQIGGMGFGHKKLLDEFLGKKFKSSKNIEINENLYLLKLIHSIYNNINKRKKFNRVVNLGSKLGKK